MEAFEQLTGIAFDRYLQDPTVTLGDRGPLSWQPCCCVAGNGARVDGLVIAYPWSDMK